MWKSDGLKQNEAGVFYMQFTHMRTREERVTMLTDEEAGLVIPPTRNPVELAAGMVA